MNKRLKLTQPLYVGYTGMIGKYKFVDGISEELIPSIERIRIAANFKVVEIDEEGNELGNPSPAHTTVANYNTRLASRRLPRQTEEEKAAENVRVVVGNIEQRTLLSRVALEAVAADRGIAGLREISGPWNVKSKSIPALIELILEAQDKYAANQSVAMQERGVAPEEIAKLLVRVDALPGAAPVEPVKPVAEVKVEAPVVKAEDASLAMAAATGDLAAAISTETTEGSADSTAESATSAETPAEVSETPAEVVETPAAE